MTHFGVNLCMTVEIAVVLSEEVTNGAENTSHTKLVVVLDGLSNSLAIPKSGIDTDSVVT